MHKLIIPVDNFTFYKEQKECIKELKRLKTDTVFLAVDAYETDEKKLNEKLNILKKNIDFIKTEGLKVGVWLWSFMITGKENEKYVHITSPSGAVSQNEICPSDENFLSFSQNYIKKIASLTPDIILFDDDFRYGFLDCGLGCTCKNHRKKIAELLNENIDKVDLNKKIFSGGKNKYRTAFLKANGFFLKEFAKKMREAVDSENKSIRLGICSCMDVWDFTGVSADELSIILAGETKPFLRLIGAPYWAKRTEWGRIEDVIEYERMEKSWCKKGIEIFPEGDVYPRPRFEVPSAYLEIFDIALRVNSNLDGSFKYMMDYFSSVGYEKGYILRHELNQLKNEKILKLFKGKKSVGIRVYEFKNKFEKAVIPKEVAGTDGVEDLFFSVSNKMLAENGFPTVYEGIGEGGIAFGENARYLKEKDINGGLIIDLRAAEILSERGIDVGLSKVKEEILPQREKFIYNDNEIRCDGLKSFDVETVKDAKIESKFIVGDKEYTGSYLYENNRGQRFLVFSFNAYFNNAIFYRNYERQKEIARAIEFFGKKLSAFTVGNPDVYLTTKKSGKSLSVFVANCFEDSLLNAEINLGEEYSKIKCVGVKGKLMKNKVVLEEVAPFSYFAFKVSK